MHGGFPGGAKKKKNSSRTLECRIAKFRVGHLRKSCSSAPGKKLNFAHVKYLNLTRFARSDAAFGG